MAAAATDELGEFYVRYYVGHKGKFGHEFLEFEFRPDGKLRDANNSNYENDTMIRKEFFLTHAALKECRRIITDSEAFLNQELGKVQDSGVELCEAKGGTSSNAGKAAAAGVKSITLDRASQIWKTLLDRTEHSANVTSGPVEDSIAHREHRIRIDATMLRASMDQDAGRPCLDSSCSRRREENPGHDGTENDGIWNNDTCNKSDERNGKDASPLDVSEVLRRWTNALQRIHKQALRLVQVTAPTVFFGLFLSASWVECA